MVKFATIVALVAPLVAARPQDKPLIVGGTAASAGDFPFIVSISYQGGPWCGGTLLNANTVLTAAHCTSGRAASAFQVRAGSLNRNSGGVTSSVSSIRIHPSFSSSTLNNDVSILKLSTPIASSSTISYGRLAASGSDPAAGSDVTVAGWGVTSQGSSSSPVALRKVTIPVVSRTTCRSQYGTSAITTNMFCAGLAEGGKDSCQGDSGGPIVDTSNTVVGVVSWGEGCAQPNFSGVYARVGTLRTYIDGQL
ncbi:Trypsin [Fusarium oligoseptatum]|uniref:Trypsin n=2 Tax=Fusarium solani species complex TaxID=232080 RepID=A0A428TZ19_9HYPO|nr:Trypsin [Fusarium floridanum]RSM07262.1 Trypsin [Fusarium oligoseptatum]